MISLHTVLCHIRLIAISYVFFFLIADPFVRSSCNLVLQPLVWMFQFIVRLRGSPRIRTWIFRSLLERTLLLDHFLFIGHIDSM